MVESGRVRLGYILPGKYYSAAKSKERIMDFDYTYADYLGEKEIKAIAKLEQKLGKRLMAYYTPPVTSNLDEKDLSKIKDLEKKLCVRLVAFDTH